MFFGRDETIDQLNGLLKKRVGGKEINYHR